MGIPSITGIPQGAVPQKSPRQTDQNDKEVVFNRLVDGGRPMDRRGGSKELGHPNTSKEHRQTFIKWLEYNLNYNYSSVLNRYNQELKDTPWVKTTQGFQKPFKCFVNDNELKEILGDTVPYIEDDLSEEIISVLKINTEVTTTNILEILRSARGDNLTPLDPSQLLKLYEALHRTHIPLNEIFSKEGLIHIPNTEKKWFTSSEVIWQDVSEFGDTFIGLNKYYPDKLKSFFVNKLKISETIKPESFYQLWLSMQESHAIDEHIDIKLKTIYENIRIQIQRDPDQQWLKKLKNEALVYTQNDEWSSPASNKLFIADDSHSQEIFKDQISLVYLPDNNHYKWMEPITEFPGIKKLSELVEYHHLSDNASSIVTAKSILTEHSCLMLCYAIRNISPDGDKHLQDYIADGTIEALYSMQEVQIKNLLLQAQIRGTSFVRQIDQQPCFIDWNNKRLFIDPSSEDRTIDASIATALSRHLRSDKNRDSEDTFRLCLRLEDEVSMLKEIDRKGWELTPEQQKSIHTIAISAGIKNPLMLSNDKHTHEYEHAELPLPVIPSAKHNTINQNQNGSHLHDSKKETPQKQRNSSHSNNSAIKNQFSSENYYANENTTYLLAVVENINASHTITIHFIKNPASLIMEYKFDSIWIQATSPLKNLDLNSIATKPPHTLLCEQTELETCKEIILHCHTNQYSLPKVGDEITNQRGEVIFDKLELVWVNQNIAILSDSVDMELATQAAPDWNFFSPDDVSSICDFLDQLFQQK
nr:hypothetical protein [Endozoicomonas sp.]